jgi:predicted transposase YdaD
MKMKNDVSFLFDKTLSLYEHQSTYNPNMPLRGFLYFADLYRQLIKDNERIYSKKLVKIPAPKYIVFYNGEKKHMPEQVKELHLSDAFDGSTEPGRFEWTATMVNINAGMNPELLAKCKALEGYVTFVDKVRTYNKNMPLTDAVDQAVDECVESGVLEEFLNKHRKEVRNMVLTEFDEEKFLRMMREEERAEGHKEGHKAGLEAGLRAGRLEDLMDRLRELGEISSEFAERIKTLDTDSLKKWNRLAARAESMEAFLEQIKEQ